MDSMKFSGAGYTKCLKDQGVAHKNGYVDGTCKPNLNALFTLDVCLCTNVKVTIKV